MVNKSGDKVVGVSSRVDSGEGSASGALGPHRPHQNKQRIPRDNKPDIQQKAA